MLKAHGDWMPLGNADEQKPAAEGTVEAWGRAENNPVGGWYGQKKGLRGRFGVYVPPVLVEQGRAAPVAIHRRRGTTKIDVDRLRSQANRSGCSCSHFLRITA